MLDKPHMFDITTFTIDKPLEYSLLCKLARHQVLIKRWTMERLVIAVLKSSLSD